MKKNKDGLYPCPFCGNRDVSISTCRGEVKCRCGGRSPMISKYIIRGLNEREAISAAWNQRDGVEDEI